MKSYSDLPELAEVIHLLLKSDRDVVMAVAGFTGEGKSCFLTQLQKAYSKASTTKWDFSHMTWSRKELLTWIDGKTGSKPKTNGLKEEQKPEYTAILADELFNMFYRRNWFEDDQISAIATFNMCRDRHLFVGGNVPDFWDLDGSFQKRVRFYAYIPTRGVAWIFEQENNPFSSDPWNVQENRKQFRKNKNPYKLKNFVCEIQFNDWTPTEKKEYYEIRNNKRHQAINENKKEKVEQYRDIKQQRDNLIRLILNKTKIKIKDLSEVISISKEAIRLIKEGLR